MIKIFLVEDEVLIRNGIKNSINWEKEGYVFAGEAGDGELAYPLILKEKPDILLTDIKMPFMDGLELSEAVKKELPDIKIICSGTRIADAIELLDHRLAVFAHTSLVFYIKHGLDGMQTLRIQLGQFGVNILKLVVKEDDIAIDRLADIEQAAYFHHSIIGSTADAFSQGIG